MVWVKHVYLDAHNNTTIITAFISVYTQNCIFYQSISIRILIVKKISQDCLKIFFYINISKTNCWLKPDCTTCRNNQLNKWHVSLEKYDANNKILTLAILDFKWSLKYPFSSLPGRGPGISCESWSNFLAEATTSQGTSIQVYKRAFMLSKKAVWCRHTRLP